MQQAEAPQDWAVVAGAVRLHIIPRGDLREHIIDECCWCKPYDDEGLVVHNSMDRREEFERGDRKPT